MSTLYFRFKSEKIVSANDVLKNPLDYPEYPPYYYLWAMNDRKWDGVPHITDLLQGTREAFLKYTADQTIDLDSAAPMLGGTFRHGPLMNMGNPFGEHTRLLLELPVKYLGVQGKLDSLFIDYNKKMVVIDDLKTGAAFSYKTYMGYGSRQVPVLDEFGNQVLLKSGKNKGQPKTKSEVVIDPSNRDNFNYDTQASFYAYAVQATDPSTTSFNFHTWIHFMLRDGGLGATMSQGLTEHNYREAVTLMDSGMLTTWVTRRRDALIQAIESGVCPSKCNDLETWQGKKCQPKHCSVCTVCEKIGE